MKKYLLSAFVILSLHVSGQPDTIPNAGFETWNFIGWTVDPQDWTVNNTQLLAANIVPDSDSYSGFLGMELINSGNFRPYASCGFPLTHVPESMTGFVKNNLNFNDTAVITVRLFSNGIVVDSGYSYLVGGFVISGYYPFMVTLPGNVTAADSCEIELLGGNMYLSQVSYDDLSLTFPAGTHDESALEYIIYPNPCTDRVTVILSGSPGYSAAIFDSNGKLIQQQVVAKSGDRAQFNTSGLASGMYLVVLQSAMGSAATPFVKEK